MTTTSAPLNVPAAFVATDDETATTLWTGFLTRRQVVIMAVAAVVEIAITVGLMHMAATRSAEVRAAQQSTAPAAGLQRGLQFSTPDWAVQRPGSAS